MGRYRTMSSLNPARWVEENKTKEKSRDAQWLNIVNELRESIKHIIKNKNVHPYEYHHYTRDNIISLLSADLTKADQMLEEMGIK